MKVEMIRFSEAQPDAAPPKKKKRSKRLKAIKEVEDSENSSKHPTEQSDIGINLYEQEGSLIDDDETGITPSVKVESQNLEISESPLQLITSNNSDRHLVQFLGRELSISNDKN